ncbi:MAG: Ig-like domain repeat protein [Terriglobales bacterium]
MIRRLGLNLLTVVAIVSFVNLACQAQPQALLTHHARQAALNGEAKLVGRLPATQAMHVDVVLPLRHEVELQSFIQQLNDPSSSSYHQFLTPEEFTVRFGPSTEDWDALVAFAKANGFEVLKGTVDSRDLQLVGTVAAVEKAFHVTLGVYQHPTESRTFFAPDREPTVDLPFQLWHITGLDNYSIPHPMYKRKAPSVKSNATTGSCPSASFCGSDMRAAYYGGTALTGTGQNVGLLEYYGTDLSDLSTYYKNAGQTQPFTPTLISTDGTSTSCTYPACDDTEQTLDMTQAMGMAPGMTMLYMYVGSSDTAIISAMVVTTDAPLSMQIGCSWGWSPADASTLDPYFEQMAAQGQNFFAASGDSSAWSNSNLPWPADDANIVSVGGTDLTTASAGGAWATETGWADSGGGVSPSDDDIPIPAWQTSYINFTTCTKCSKTLRNGPDVSANANFTFYVCADQTTCTANEYGGTSFAAPMWAGYLALANQQAAANSETIGYINPIIYQAAAGSSYSTLFHDITSGKSGSHTATSGYDLVTGWGSPNGNGLINLLAPPAGAATTTALTSSLNPSTVGVSVTFAATVSPSPGTVGTMAFSSNGTTITGCGTVALTDGVATCTTSFAAVGTYSIVATYSGGTGYKGSTSNTLAQVVNQGSTTTALASSVNPSTAGQSVTFTATISGGTSPTGTVGFTSNGTAIGGCSAVTVAAGSAACTTSFAAVGTYAIVATYSGDSNNLGSTSGALSQVVNKSTTTTALASSVNPSNVGQSVMFTATVSGGAAPTGTVGFTSNGTAISGCSAAVLTSGSATCNTSFSASGTDSIVTTYSGDSNNSGSVSSALAQVVNKAATASSLASSLNPSIAGQAVTFTAIVSGGSSPTGTFSFTANGTAITGCSAVALSSAQAQCSTSTLPVGGDAIVATYSGDVNNAGSSAALTQIVNSGTVIASTTVVTSSLNPSTVGAAVTFTASVSPTGPPAPTGMVSFTANGTAITGCTGVALSSATATCATSTLPVGTDAIVATYSGDVNYGGSIGTLTQLVNPVASAVQFVPLSPCRVVDTRNADGPFGGPEITIDTSRSFTIPAGPCPDIPTNATAYSLNVTVVPPGPLGYVTIWPTGEGQPYVSTLNSLDGRIKANAAVVPAGTGGAVSVYANNTTNVVLDINGYFLPTTGTSLEFYPLTPCRVADTRTSTGSLGGPALVANTERDFPIQSSSCGIPSTALAYSLNFTAVPPTGGDLGYLTVWPQGETQPLVSTLNDLTGTIVANAALVPAGTGGGVAVYPSDATNLVIDVNGYFAPPGTGGLQLYGLTPCRVLDTRKTTGNFSGELTVNVAGSTCAPPATAQAYVFNATVVPAGNLGYLTLWPDSETQPVVSTLNAPDGYITSNMALVPNVNGSTDAYASGTTQLVMDIFGYFAP